MENQEQLIKVSAVGNEGIDLNLDEKVIENSDAIIELNVDADKCEGIIKTSEESFTGNVENTTELDSLSAKKEELKANPNFAPDVVLSELSEEKQVNLDDVWFVETVDTAGVHHVDPYIMFKKINKEIETYVGCLNGGWCYKSEGLELFAVLDGFVSAKRWQAFDLESYILEEKTKEMIDPELDDPTKQYMFQIELDMDCVVSGKTHASVSLPVTKKTLYSVQQEYYRKFFGKACYKIYDKRVVLNTTYGKVREYAKEYEKRVNSRYAIQEQKESSYEPKKKFDLLQNGRVNLENLWYVTRIADGKFEVLPCVVNPVKNLFVEVSSGNVYELDENGGFTNISGFVFAKRWREMELSFVRINENIKDLTEEGEAYLDQGFSLVYTSSPPYHLYSFSSNAVMTKNVSVFLTANAVSSEFKDFRDKNARHCIGKVFLNVLDPKFDPVRTVGEVCIYAREYTDRLNVKSKVRDDTKQKLTSYDLILYESDMRKKQKQTKTKGLFARMKKYFSNKKRLRKAHDKFDKE